MPSLTFSQRDALMAEVQALRRRAQPIGPLHGGWDLIADAEAFLRGRSTLAAWTAETLLAALREANHGDPAMPQPDPKFQPSPEVLGEWLLLHDATGYEILVPLADVRMAFSCTAATLNIEDDEGDPQRVVSAVRLRGFDQVFIIAYPVAVVAAALRYTRAK